MVCGYVRVMVLVRRASRQLANSLTWQVAERRSSKWTVHVLAKVMFVLN